MARGHRATYAEIFTAAEHLKAHCRKANDGFAEYEAEWSDETIAALVGGNMGADKVKDMRVEMFGKLRPKLLTDEDRRTAAHNATLELAGIVSKIALSVAEVVEGLGDSDRGKILRGLAHEACMAE